MYLSSKPVVENLSASSMLLVKMFWLSNGVMYDNDSHNDHYSVIIHITLSFWYHSSLILVICLRNYFDSFNLKTVLYMKLKFAAVLSVMYSLIMMIVLVGLLQQGLDKGICSVTIQFTIFVGGVFLTTALLHPKVGTVEI